MAVHRLIAVINEETQEHIDRAMQTSHACLKCKYSLDGIDPSGACPECGTPIIDGCVWCAYDLSDTEPNGVCPECGVPVHCSIGSSALGGVSTEQLQSVHAGFRLVTYLLLFFIIFIVLLIATMFMNFRATGSLIGITALVICIGVVLGTIFGWFKLSQPLTGLPRKIDKPGIRSLVRVMLWVFIGVAILSLINGLVAWAPLSEGGSLTVRGIANGVLFVLLGSSAIVLFVANVLYIGWFARLVRNQRIQKRAKHFVWTGPTVAILGAMLLCFVPIFPLIVLALYLDMIESIRIDLKKIIKARPPAV
tara:strand:+ start:13542 stop:14462 length:921 start_codon:yes stop_codon:yes gene_type:complete